MPYLFGSRIDSKGTPDSKIIECLTDILYRHFPIVRPFSIEYASCGVLGVPRDWWASVGLDKDTGLRWAGGYAAVGVSTSNLAGRTLAELVLDSGRKFAKLPWVNRKVKKWAPEPFRRIGVHGMYA